MTSPLQWRNSPTAWRGRDTSEKTLGIFRELCYFTSDGNWTFPSAAASHSKHLTGNTSQSMSTRFKSAVDTWSSAIVSSVNHPDFRHVKARRTHLQLIIVSFPETIINKNNTSWEIQDFFSTKSLTITQIKTELLMLDKVSVTVRMFLHEPSTDISKESLTVLDSVSALQDKPNVQPTPLNRTDPVLSLSNTLVRCFPETD